MTKPILLLISIAMAAISPPEQRPASSVTVERNGDSWTADYRLHARAPVWIFAKPILAEATTQSWRRGNTRVLTPGLRLERFGHYDALVSSGGPLPSTVRLSFTPYTEGIEAGHDPALALSDGSVALYADAFRLLPMHSREAARSASADYTSLSNVARHTRMAFLNRSGTVLAHGKRSRKVLLENGETYVLFGQLTPRTHPAITTMLDPGLPGWMSNYLSAELPRILAEYRKRLGPSPGGRPALLVSWKGPTQNEVGFSGGVLPRMVVMTLWGDRMVQPNDKLAHHARWFVAHEAAHFWLGEAVEQSERSESWITEGGAELLAFRATAAIDPTFDIKARLTQARAECLPFLASGGIASAHEREGDFRAYYACGVILALAAERASGGDFAHFVRSLIGRFGADGSVSRMEWMTLLNDRASSTAISVAAAKLLDHRQTNPERSLDEFIAVAKIGDAFDTSPSSHK